MEKKTPVNSIVIPNEYLKLCNRWYGWDADVIYAIRTVGRLALGRDRPIDCDTDEKWYLSLWRSLSANIIYARLSVCCRYCFIALVRFERWVNGVIDRLAREYDLEK